MVKNWVSPYLPKQEKLENLCLIAVHQRNFKLRPLIIVTSKWLFAINISSWILTLFVVMQESRTNNLSSDPFLSLWQT